MKKGKKIRNIEKKALNIPSVFLKKLGSHISQVGGLYIHTPTQLKKKSKTYLIKEILRLEKIILRITYNAYKMQLPKLKTTKQKALPKNNKSKKKNKEKKKRTAKQKRADKKNGDRLKKWMRDNK